MLIISVVVAVTIGVTKKKLDSTVSYTYYSAYESLKDVSRSLLADFNPNSDKYKAGKTPVEFLAEASGHTTYTALLNSLWVQPSIASNTVCPSGYELDKNGNCIKLDHAFDGNFGQLDPGTGGNTGLIKPEKCYLLPDGTEVCPEDNPSVCNPLPIVVSRCESQGGTWDLASCECKDSSDMEVGCSLTSASSCTNKGWSFNWTTCECTKPSDNDKPYCPNEQLKKTQCVFQGGTWKSESCSCDMPTESVPEPEACPITECPSAQHLVDADKSTCKCVADEPSEPDEPASVCNPGDTPPACGQQCVGGQWESIAGFSKTCNDTQEWRDLPDCKCVPIARTLPRNGQKFCEQFEQRVNTKAGIDYCEGTTISATTTDFSNAKADIILRNGMKIYNVHTNPQKIEELAGNKSGFTVQVASSGELSLLPSTILKEHPLGLFSILSGLFDSSVYASWSSSGWSSGNSSDGYMTTQGSGSGTKCTLKSVKPVKFF